MRPFFRTWAWCAFLVMIGVLFTLSCGGPSERFNDRAQELGISHRTYPGTEFKHHVYLNHKPFDGILHVYLGSDGTPWESPRRIASNPTPRNPIMLSLMARDPIFSLYLGRPCYHEPSISKECHAGLWTTDRYSPIVLKSLTVVLSNIWEEFGHPTVILFGYSGGGTLAMLLGNEVSFIRGIVTLAGNLDHTQWVRHHGFSPLTGSRNPASEPPLPTHIFQRHFVGEFDEVVPPWMITQAVERLNGGPVIILRNMDHRCCWEAIWPRILHQLPPVSPWNSRLDHSRTGLS